MENVPDIISTLSKELSVSASELVGTYAPYLVGKLATEAVICVGLLLVGLIVFVKAEHIYARHNKTTTKCDTVLQIVLITSAVLSVCCFLAACGTVPCFVGAVSSPEGAVIAYILNMFTRG